MRAAVLAAISAATLVAGSALASGDRELGKHLSSECVSCHQLSGRVSAGVPAIVGIDHKSFTAMMEAYRKRERPNQVMQSIASKFSDEEIAALAAFFESVKKK